MPDEDKCEFECLLKHWSVLTKWKVLRKDLLRRDKQRISYLPYFNKKNPNRKGIFPSASIHNSLRDSPGALTPEAIALPRGAHFVDSLEIC